MSGIIYGLYEQIINGIINENLNKVDLELVIKDTQPLDSAESSKILADYLTRILREIFDYIMKGIPSSETELIYVMGFCSTLQNVSKKGALALKRMNQP